MLKFSVRLVALFCFFATASTALAEGFALYEYSARGVALGGSMMARKPDASAVAYNPALLTKLKGTHLMGGVTGVMPSGKMDWKERSGREGTTELRDSIWGIPHGYYTHQINEDFYFGIGEFTRYGLGFEYPHNWPGRFNIYEVSLISGSLNPNIAWKATDELSLAAGVELVYVSLDMKKRAALGALPNGTLLEVDSNIKNANAFGVGFNLAGHYQFNEQWAAGLQYRSQVRVHAKGDVEFTSTNVPSSVFNSRFKDGEADSTVILPDSVAAGVSYTPIPELSFEVGAVWTRWSTFRSLNIHLPGSMPTSESKKNWKDVWRLNAGVEYQALDWLALRGGFVWDQSPMTSKYEDYLVPTGDRQIWSAGVGFNWDAWTLDLAYAFIKPESRSYRNDQRDGGTWTINSKTRDARTQLFSVSLGYTF